MRSSSVRPNSSVSSPNRTTPLKAPSAVATSASALPTRNPQAFQRTAATTAKPLDLQTEAVKINAAIEEARPQQMQHTAGQLKGLDLSLQQTPQTPHAPGLTDTQIETLVAKHKQSHGNLQAKNIRNIATNIAKNNGEFISTQGKGKGPAWAEAIAVDIIALQKGDLPEVSKEVQITALGTSGTKTRCEAYIKKHDGFEQAMKEKLITQLAGEIGLKPGQFFDGKCESYAVLDTSVYNNCHQVTFGDPKDDPDVMDAPVNLQAFKQMLRDPQDTVAVFFTEGQVSHTAKAVGSNGTERVFQHGLMGDERMVIDPDIKKGDQPATVQVSASITFKTLESRLRVDPKTIVLIHAPGSPITDAQWAEAVTKTRPK